MMWHCRKSSREVPFPLIHGDPMPTLRAFKSMFHIFRCASVFLALGMMTVTARNMSAQTATCIVTPDSSSIRLRSFVRDLVTGSDESSVRVRATLGLSTMDSTKVVVLNNVKTCAKVVTGVNAALKTAPATRQLYVYVLGRNYAVFDPEVVVQSQGGAVVFLDSQFNPIDIVLAGSVY
jgi:hypothetical protein